MTLQEYNTRLKALANDVAKRNVGQFIVPPATNLLSTIKQRIQRDGKNSDGGNIGQYSTDPMYVSRGQFIKKAAFKAITKATITSYRSTSIKINSKTGKVSKGKTNYETIEKSKGKTMYLRDGYKELRDIQGRPTDKVNFTYSGDLMLSYQLQAKDNEVLLGLVSEKEALKREGLEKRFGKTFKATKTELSNYRKEVVEGEQEFITSKLKR